MAHTSLKSDPVSTALLASIYLRTQQEWKSARAVREYTDMGSDQEFDLLKLEVALQEKMLKLAACIFNLTSPEQ